MTVSEKLRLVQGLYSHAEMFGFHWDDGSDWTWHDVTCKIADEVDAENAKLREYAHSLELETIRLDSDNCDLRGEMEPVWDENAKLRELATGLYRCWQGEECEGCPMQDDDGWCVRDIQLRELGVETDE